MTKNNHPSLISPKGRRLDNFFRITLLLAILLLLGGVRGGCQNIGINTSGAVPDNSALLEIGKGTSAAPDNMGVLIPRVKLTSTTDVITIPSPAYSLLVYNLGTGGLSPAGYYYNANTTPGSATWTQLGGGGGSGWLLTGNTGITTPAAPATYGTSLIGAAENWMGTTDAKDVVFGTSNKERMRIDQLGYVGIGIAPTAGWPLTVRSPVMVFSTLGNALMSGGNGISSSLIIANNSIGYAPSGITIANVAGGSNVGIDTYTPGSKLGVNGNASFGYYNGMAAPAQGMLVPGQVLIGPDGAASYDFVSKGMTSGGGSGNLVLNGAAGSNGIRFTSSGYDWGGVGLADYYFGIANNGASTNGNLILQQYASASGSGIAITPSNRIGIGALDPQSSLNIQAAVPAAGSRPTGGIFFTTPNNANVRGQIGLVQNTGEGNHYLLIQTVEDAVAWRDVVLARDGGNAGIGRLPTANNLEVAGNASKATATAWLANSDRRIKTDIRDIDNAVGIVMKLRPVVFRYNDEWKRRNPYIASNDHDYYNFIAQEYQKVFPESVQGSGEYLESDTTHSAEILQIDTYNAQIVSIKAIQEQQQMIKDSEERIQKLEEENKKLTSQILILKSDYDSLFEKLEGALRSTAKK